MGTDNGYYYYWDLIVSLMPPAGRRLISTGEALIFEDRGLLG